AGRTARPPAPPPDSAVRSDGRVILCSPQEARRSAPCARTMNPRLGTLVRDHLVAVRATAAAVLLRWALDRWMGDALPLATLYGAVALAVWVGGIGPAVLACVLGFVACDLLFIAPRGQVVLDARTLIGV